MSQENVDRFRAGVEAFNRGDIERWFRTITRMRSSSLRSLRWRATTQGSMT